MTKVYAIIECPNCGRSECKIHTTSRSAIRHGHDAGWEQVGADVNYSDLKASFDKGPVECSKCGAELKLIKPDGIMGE